jgi:hypothetical protein
MNLHFNGLDWGSLAGRTQALLPLTDSLPWLRHLAWSGVLAAGVLLLARIWQRRHGTAQALGGGSIALAMGAMVWAWTPDVMGSAYWLGLAFQTPSAVATLLAFTLVRRECHATWQARGGGRAPASASGEPNLWIFIYVGGGVVLGWVLLLDTFALFPVSVYAWGFQPAALACVLALALAPWVLAGHAAWRGPGLVQVWAALALYGLGRWPSGNVWDALLDPWLWLLLQGQLLRGLTRRWRSPG